MNARFPIERLANQDRGDFDCGVAALNAYFVKQASQDERRLVAACYLLVERTTGAIASYYTLSAASILFDALPAAAAKKLPRYPTVPAMRLGRLAIDVRFQGQKLGGVLLYNGIQRAATTDVGVYAVVVDAKDDGAAAFFRHHGFVQFASLPKVLFLPLMHMRKSLS